MTQTVQAPQYETMSKADLIGIIESQRTIIQRFYQLLPIPNTVMSPGEKLALAVVAPLLAREKPDEHGRVRMPIDAIGERIGMSGTSAGRYMTNLCKRFDATHELVEYTTKKGQSRKLVYVDPTDRLWSTPPDELEIAPEKERVINGNKCPHCRSEGTYHIKKRTIASQEVGTCECCGYMKVFPVFQDNAPLDPMEYRPEKASQPEDLLAMPLVEVSPVDVAEPPITSEKALQPEDLLEKVKNLHLSTVYTLVATCNGSQVAPRLSAVQELQALSNWVMWRYEMVNEKWTKVPYIAERGRGKARSNDPATWRTFDQAQALYQLSLRERWDNPYDGIGFMCDGTLTGVDLDHCRNKETGEINEWARDIVQRLASYTYITPSEEGLRIITRATIPAGRKLPTIELYCRGRFFTWQDTPLPGTPVTIEDRQQEIDALLAQLAPKECAPLPKTSPAIAPGSCSRSDAEILDKARNAANGAKFCKLFDRGDASDYRKADGSPDESRADLALCGMLAYWTDEDVSTIDRLFQRSGLMREKWYEKRGKETYGEKTIAMALNGPAWQAAS